MIDSKFWRTFFIGAFIFTVIFAVFGACVTVPAPVIQIGAALCAPNGGLERIERFIGEYRFVCQNGMRSDRTTVDIAAKPQ